ncbi:MAG: class I SAM-dependent methyltransferase [Tunicatimonas sp.]
MKLSAQPENLLEALALRSGMVPTPLGDTHVAFMLARTIMVATKLGIFEALADQSATAEQVAQRCATAPAATQKMLNTLVHLGYLRLNQERYALTALTSRWLLQDSAQSVYDKMLFQFTEWEMVAGYENYVRSGQPFQMHETFSTKQWTAYQRGMRAMAGTAAGEVARRTPMPRRAKDMLDIGGAHGYYSVALCRRHKGLRSVILDLPEAVDEAQHLLAKEQMGGRVVHQAGNALTDDLGQAQYDIVLIASLVHHFDEETNRDLMQRIARALRPGGVLVVQEFMRSPHPRRGDHLGALLDLFFAATSESGTWSVEEITDWQRAAGLQPRKPIWLRSIPRHAQQVAKKPR